MYEQSPQEKEQSLLLKEKLVARIRAEGPITFADFMHESLYGDLGFFSTRRAGIDAGTTFLKSTTSPEISPIFAQVIASPVYDAWDEMGKPERFDVVEMGAGTGSFASDFVKTVKRTWPDFYESMHYTIVKLSPSLMDIQRNNIADPRVNWVYGSAIDLPLRDLEGVLISNELVDNLPFHRVIAENGKLKEIFVTEEDGELQDVKSKPSVDFREHLRKIGVTVQNGVELHL